jgi:hypothetical protein
MFVFQVPSNPVPASAAAGSSSVGIRSLIASHLYPLFYLVGQSRHSAGFVSATLADARQLVIMTLCGQSRVSFKETEINALASPGA